MLVSNHWTKSRFGVGLVNRFGDEELTAKEPLPVGSSTPTSTQSQNVQGAGTTATVDARDFARQSSQGDEAVLGQT